MHSMISSQQIDLVVEQTLRQFQRLMHKYLFFHAFFFSLFFFELVALLVFMPFFAKTSGVAIMVSMTFLTIFAYFVLRFYFQTRKSDQLMLLRNQFLKATDHFAQQLDLRNGWSVESLAPIYHLLKKIEQKEPQHLELPPFLKTCAPLLIKLSIWCYWEDVQWLKETLHLHVIRKIFEWIQEAPTDIELHRILARAYVNFYQIYQLPIKESPYYSLIVRQYELNSTRERFEKAARCAAEELKVVLAYEATDLWALSQIAKVYHDLGSKQEEKEIYETILSLKPQDGNVQYQLGKLYFELGHIIQGLNLYHQLQKLNDFRAKELIQHYNHYFNNDS